MTWGFTAVAAATVYSANRGSSAASQAAETQAASTDAAAQLQRETAQEQLALQKRIYEEGIARQQPWYEAGKTALTKLQGIPETKFLFPTFTGKVDVTQDPGYAFRLSEGQKALERSAAARGGLLSGAAGKALTRYGQEMGSQEYQNAYNRAFQKYGTDVQKYEADVQQDALNYNRLASLAGVGQTTAQQIGTAGQNYATASGNIASQSASNIGEALTSGAAARASGYVGGANAISQALGQGINLYGMYNQNQLYNRMFPQVPTIRYPGVDASSVMG